MYGHFNKVVSMILLILLFLDCLLESSIICFCQSPFVYFFCAHIYYLHVHECLFVLLYITLCKAVYTKCFKKNICSIQSGQFGILIWIFHHSWILIFSNDSSVDQWHFPPQLDLNFSNDFSGPVD